MAPAVGLEPTTRRLTEGLFTAQIECLRQLESGPHPNSTIHDPPCSTVRHGDSSASVTGLGAEYTEPPSVENLPPVTATPEVATAGPPMVTSEEAIRLAAKLALDERDDELAARLLDLLRRDR